MTTSLINYEKLFAGMMTRAIRKGKLSVRYPSGKTETYGTTDEAQASITLKTAQTVRDIYLDPALKFAEMYMDGDLDIEEDNLDAFIQIIKINGSKSFKTLPAIAITLTRVAGRLCRRYLIPETAEKNVAHHYDLDEKLFRLFLDDDLQYSCAYFEKPSVTLEEAQLAKKRHIAAKMMIKPGQKILDIGCGWGGMALFLATHLDADVTGITLSKEQQRVAEQRSIKQQLTDKVRFNLRDYRDVNEQFDRIVSVGMFEHVGPQNFSSYFDSAKKLMKDDGVFLLHSIGRAKPNMFDPPFVEKYIFPNGHIPSLSEALRAIEKSGLLVKDVEILTYHYADTIKHWRERFYANKEKVLELYDERFFRMWDLYLATSELSFRHGKLYNFQIQIVKQQSTSHPTRDYIKKAEDKLKKTAKLKKAA